GAGAGGRGGGRGAPSAAALFALASLTRPDGLLLGGSVLGVAALIEWRAGRLPWRRIVADGATFAAIIGPHLLWRHAYYGEWVPNSYFAKVGGDTWWGMGLRYLAVFAIEYAAWMWVPLLVLAARRLRRTGRGHEGLLFAAAIVPHAVYVIAIGGDHFEFRPFDLYFPLVYLLLGDGLCELASATRRRWPAAAATVAVAGGLLALTVPAHCEFAPDYRPAFPGHRNEPDARAYLDPARSDVYALPGLRWLAALHRSLLREMTWKYVGVRQEEHALVGRNAIEHGRALRALVDRGRLPADAYIATNCVGAIPYYSRLRTLDRHGLTDAAIAKSPRLEHRAMAHDRFATLDYARERGVDLWAEDPVYLAFRLDQVVMLTTTRGRLENKQDAFVADLGDGWFAPVILPCGLEAVERRFPGVQFTSCADHARMAEFYRRGAEACGARAAAHPHAAHA